MVPSQQARSVDGARVLVMISDEFSFMQRTLAEIIAVTGMKE